MAEFLASHIAVVKAKAADVSSATQPNAHDLRGGRAALARTAAITAYIEAFETANRVLQASFNDGDLSPLETVTAVAELGDIDPALRQSDNPPRAGRIIQAFRAQEAGTPVLDLKKGGAPQHGMVSGLPKVVELITPPTRQGQPMAPTATLAVPLQIARYAKPADEALLQIEVSSLTTTTIGRTAIQQHVSAVEFSVDYDAGFSITNSVRLYNLRSAIGDLHQLGMKPIDSSALDVALGKSADYFAAPGHRMPSGR